MFVTCFWGGLFVINITGKLLRPLLWACLFVSNITGKLLQPLLLNIQNSQAVALAWWDYAIKLAPCSEALASPDIYCWIISIIVVRRKEWNGLWLMCSCGEEGWCWSFCIFIAKHMQKSVPVKATGVRAGGGGGSAAQHKPAQQNHVVPGTSVAVTTPQRPPSGASTTPQSVVNRPPAVSTSSHPASEQMLRHELQKLQKEKERLRREQEEAVRKVSLFLMCSCLSLGVL